MVAKQPTMFATEGLPTEPPTARGSVTSEVTIAAPVGSVWQALTDPDELAAWFGAEVEIDASVGGAVRFRWPDGAERRGLVLDLDPPRRLAFRWRSLRSAPGEPSIPEAAVVTFDLRPDGDATRVVVTESPGALPGTPASRGPA